MSDKIAAWGTLYSDPAHIGSEEFHALAEYVEQLETENDTLNTQIQSVQKLLEEWSAYNTENLHLFGENLTVTLTAAGEMLTAALNKRP